MPHLQPLDARRHLCFSHQADDVFAPALAQAVASVSIKVDFLPPGGSAQAGHLADQGRTFGDRGNGYRFGWNTDVAGHTRDRNSPAAPDARHDTLVHTQKQGNHRWEIELPDGSYDVRLVAGDPSYWDSVYRFDVESQPSTSGTPSSGRRFFDTTRRVNVTDGRLTITNASGAVNNKLAFVEVRSAGASPSAQQPFGATPITLPGRLQVENYDTGGPGVSFSDVDSQNRGNAYRNDAVDIVSLGSGAHAIGWTRPGEWTEYTVSIPSAGTYDIDFRVRSGSAGGRFHLEVGGVDRTGSITLPNTGSWTTWRTITRTNVPLPAGEHVLRLKFDASTQSGQDIGDVDYIDFRQRGSSSLAWPTSWQSASASPIVRFESYGFEFNDKLYVMGGWVPGYDASRRADVYDPATNTWRRLRDIPIPETHAGHAIDEARGEVYFLSGHRGDFPSTFVQELWKYTIASDTWTRLPWNLPSDVGGSGGAALVNNRLYYFGGNYSWDRNANTPRHYMLDLGNTSAGWQRRADLPFARDHLSAISLNGQIYAIGGEFGHDRDYDHQRYVHRYNPATNTWTRLADLPTAKSHAESSVFVHNGRIIMAGGQIYPQSATSEVVAYDPSRNAWDRLTSLPAIRQGVVVQKVANYIVITTGSDRYTNWMRADTWLGRL